MITLLGLAHLNECDGYTCIERLTPASQRASARITFAANKPLGAKYTSRHFTRTGVINEIEITKLYDELQIEVYTTSTCGDILSCT